MEPKIDFTPQVIKNQENFFSQTRPQRPQTKPPQRSVPMFVQEEIDDLSNKIIFLKRMASGIDISEADREFLNKCLFKAHNTNDLDAQENIHIEILCCQARIESLRGQY